VTVFESEARLKTPRRGIGIDHAISEFMALHRIHSLPELRQRSVDDIEWFWDAAARFLGFRWTTPYERVLDMSAGAPWARWFVGGQLNLADNCLDRWSESTPGATALVWETEEGSVETWSYALLRRQTDRIARALVSRGIGAGDVVASYLPNRPEAVAALLAIAKVGAVALPLFSGYARDAIVTRLVLAGAKALLTTNVTQRRGVEIEMGTVAHSAAESAPTVEHVLLLPLAGEEADGEPVASLRVDSELPWLVAYTSGTTGSPKGAVHVHGGWLMQVGSDGAFALDARPAARVLWLSDPGWIMGPWTMTAALAHGGALVLLEGAVDHPRPDRLWAAVERHRPTHLGISPTLARVLMQQEEESVRRYDRSSLEALASTGEPWNERPWRWFFEIVGDGRLPVVNVSGGTEVGGAFLTPYPGDPITPMSLGGPALGMAMEVWDDEGKPISGQVGELVCTKPWPGMTRGLYRQPPQRFVETYWTRFPGVWTHGDWASVNAEGSWFLHGRSDDTIKIAGKRLGPADVESIVISHPAVGEVAAIAVPDPVKGQQLHLYVVLRSGAVPSDELRSEISELVVSGLGRSFRPGAVRFTTALPKTRTAKVMRRVIRAAALGEELGDLSSLEDPGAINAVRAAR
jgi:acetyl-CoA synthetase